MPRQCIITAAERSALLAFATEKSELIRLYALTEQDLSVAKQRAAMPIALALLFWFALCGRGIAATKILRNTPIEERRDGMAL